MPDDDMSWAGASWAQSLAMAEQDLEAWRPKEKQVTTEGTNLFGVLGLNDQITFALEHEVCEQMDDAARFDTYSGRGMMGRSCISVTGTLEQCQATIAQLHFVILQEATEWCVEDPGCRTDVLEIVSKMFQKIARYKTDSMGYDVVWYWPEMMVD